MDGTEPQFLDVGEGASRRRIAFRVDPPGNPERPSLFWLAGYKSDMASTKAMAIAEYAQAHSLGCVRSDYSGHGLSSGRFEDGTIGQWLDDAEAVFTRVSRGPQVIIGSSMGGHIALVLLRRLMAEAPDEAARIKALVLIAPAWDMTEELMWKKFDAAARKELAETGVYQQPSDYGEPYAITRALIEDGRKHLLARQPFDPRRPILILQGLQDASVPAAHTRELLAFLTGGWTRIVEVPDGGHRLSRSEDLEALFGLIEEGCGG
jgi:pimeloyl-ACP methyl ester carboxylesterase